MTFSLLVAAPCAGFRVRPDRGGRVRPSRASPLADVSLVLEKALDTLEDAALHARRQLDAPAFLAAADDDVLEAWRAADDARPRVLLLGSGWGAHALLKVIDTSRFRVLCVSPRPFFVFTPMLASTSTGTVEYRSILEPIRAANPLVSYLEGEATSIDAAARLVAVDLALPLALARSAAGAESAGDNDAPPPKLAQRLSLEYDTLVYACGVRCASFGVPGVRASTRSG